jgi:SAM-dependent methyltransferase
VSFDRYFDTRARKFAAFYRSEPVSRAIGRGPLFDRARFAVATAESIGARHVLDVGCGSGPLFEPLAAKGIRVTGLEPAPQMLELARAEAARFPGLVTVREGRWEDLHEADGYDLAVALGVFDYVGAPAELLARMGRAAPSVVGSFPSAGLRTELRKVRYGRRGVRVFPYTMPQLAALAAQCGLDVARCDALGRAGWVAHFTRSGEGPHQVDRP